MLSLLMVPSARMLAGSWERLLPRPRPRSKPGLADPIAIMMGGLTGYSLWRLVTLFSERLERVSESIDAELI